MLDPPPDGGDGPGGVVPGAEITGRHFDISHRTLVASAREAMVVVDMGGTIVLVNRLAEQLFGYDEREMLGLGVDVLIPERFRSGHEAQMRRYAASPRLREMGGEIELFGRRKDGSEFPSEVSLAPLTTAAGTYVSSSVRDITAKRSADLLGSYCVDVVESSHDAIIGNGRDGIITSWNKAAELLFGHSEAEMVGRPVSLLGAGHRQPDGDPNPGVVDPQDAMFVRKDGTSVRVSVTTSPVLGPNRSVRGWSRIARDLSGHQEADATKDAFLALVSHELRTPLSSIIAHVELLLDDGTADSDRARFANVIHRNSVRLERLVRDLLLVAQSESSAVHVTKSDLDVVDIARDAVETAAPMAAHSAIVLRLEVPVHPVMLSGDGGRLGQAIDNLIGNAIKYSPQGGDVCVRVLPGDHECAIEVQDQGVGIAFEEQIQLFERHFRSSTAVDLHIEGAGLGLMVVKAIVDAHGGRVTIASRLRAGSTFAMVLPFRADSRRELGVPVPTLAASRQ